VPPLGRYSTMDGNYILCARCGEWKHKSRFVRCNRTSRGFGSYCRRCHNARSRVNVYGEEAGEPLDANSEDCEICGSNINLRFDHSVQKSIRGILCHKCNIALGMFDHDVELLQGAIDYLERGK
jgi:hypothetical protein